MASDLKCEPQQADGNLSDLNEAYDHCLGLVPQALQFARSGDFEKAKDIIRCQEFDWWHEIYFAFDEKDVARAEICAQKLLSRAKALPELPACEMCHRSQTALMVVRDASMWTGYDNEYDEVDEISPSYGVDIFCSNCGHSTGTSVHLEKDLAVDIAKRFWSGEL